MRNTLYLVALCAALTAAAPAPEPAPAPAPQPAPAADDKPEIIEIIAPAASAQETLSTLNLGAPGSELSERNKRTIGILRQLFPTLTQNAIVEDNLLSGAESQQAEVRVAFGDGQQAQPAAAGAGDDQLTAAQTNSASIDEITLDDTDDSEENRNKRFLSFGGSAGASGGGSGNFLFDIVRLVAGSSSSGNGDAAAEGEEAGKGDNLTEGVPGPITRLFIIANRGIANLIQDLILRIAQTSERIVNFKARLITSII
ncbi:synaptonemal complex protein 4 isoform X2 [Battus philenor]|uniref:synaptonemal complex protein 4 isoform X2 n=1 Tax=Battus philenor TaxID=42288 RepID=UPI0035D0F7F7